MQDSHTYFEKQQFNQKWIKIVIISLFLACLMISVVIYANAEGALKLLSLTPLITGCLTLLLFNKMELTVKIDDQKIAYTFKPFRIKKEIYRSDIKEIAVDTYNAISDYGGWGIRISAKGRAYTVSGSYGIRIKLTDGKNILIGVNNHKQVHDYLKEHKYILGS